MGLNPLAYGNVVPSGGTGLDWAMRIIIFISYQLLSHRGRELAATLIFLAAEMGVLPMEALVMEAEADLLGSRHSL